MKRYSITLCMDGHVSIIDTEQRKIRQRRLDSALPVYTIDEITLAFELIERLCTLSRCHHGGKTGTLIEPRIIGWPTNPTLEDLERVSALFSAEHEKILRERAT